MKKRFFLIITLIFIFLQVIFAAPLKATPMETLYGLGWGESVDVPIIMYHVITPNPKNKWEITYEAFLGDIKYLKNNGYETVFMSDLIDYVYDGKPLPKNPIVLTFDDGRRESILNIMPLLNEHDIKISLAIIGSETDKYTKIDAEEGITKHPHLLWGDIEEITKNSNVEIINHSYDLHGKRGAKKLKNESDYDYAVRFSKDIQKFDETLQERNIKITKTFAYPLGMISKTSDEVLKKNGYLASLGCEQKVNTITVNDYSSLFNLKRFLRPPMLSSDTFFSETFAGETAE